nr:hypothetical protein L204_02169 [Cryptococcus depauperatus CBS 7855]
MGVTGLWDLLRPAATWSSLSTLSKEAFYANKNGLRGLTIGIDASIWIFHAAIPQHGENPFLRTIFFKITALLQHPILPVFVFVDGPNKPNFKRNQRVAGHFGTHDYRSKQFKALLDVCGLEWWNAPGEAEAELAIMNRQGKIDAVLSDDGDALLFGAKCLLRNPSPTLSGAQASNTTQANTSRSDQRQYEIYRSAAIRDLWTSKDGSALKSEEDCRMAMVLVALLSGGDYTPEGLFSIGPTISQGLASAGISESFKLYTTYGKLFLDSLQSLHERIVEELRTNSSKQIGRRYPDRASKLASLSPDQIFPAATLEAYLNPCTSPIDDLSKGWPGFGQGLSSSSRGKARNDGRGDMEGFAAACEKYFEWGTKELVCKKFASESVGVFGAEVLNEAREAIRAKASNEMEKTTSTRITSFFQQSQGRPLSSKIELRIPTRSSETQLVATLPNHILQIHSTRSDPTNPSLTEYRVSFEQEIYIKRCRDTMQGTRIDPTLLPQEERESLRLVEHSHRDVDEPPSATQVALNKSEIRVWIQDYLLRSAWPELVNSFEEKLAMKEASKFKAPKKKKATKSAESKKSRSKKCLEANGEDIDAFASFFTSPQRVSSGRNERKALRELIPNLESKQTPEIIDLSLSSSPPPSPGQSRSRRRISLEKRKLTRPPLASSMSSSLSIEGKGENTAYTRKGRGKMQKTSPRSTGSYSGVSTNMSTQTILGGANFSQRTFRKSVSSPSAFPEHTHKMKSNVIDLCSSSDDDTPVQIATPRRRTSRSSQLPVPQNVLSASSKDNEPFIGRYDRSSSRSLTAEEPTSSCSRPQRETSILNHPLLHCSTSPTLSQSTQLRPDIEPSLQEKMGEHCLPKPPKTKARKPQYKVLSNTDKMEIIDCTMRR